MALEEGKISSRQAILLIVTIIYSTEILSAPALMIKHAKQDAIFSLAGAVFAGCFIAYILAKLSCRFPGKTLFEYLEIILGKTAGKTVSIIYLWFFLYIAAGSLAGFSGVLRIFDRPNTPMMVIMILAIIPMAYMVWNGLEVMARTSEVFTPIGLVILLMVAAISIPTFKIDNFLPFFDNSLVSIVKGSFFPLAWIAEMSAAAVLFPYLSKPGDAYRVSLYSIFLAAGVLLLSLITVLAMMGPNIPASYLFPFFTSVRTIHLGIVERFESFVLVTWVLQGLIKIGIFYWVAALGSAQVFGLKTYRPLILPLGTIIVALSLISAPSVFLLVEHIATGFSFHILTFGALLPLLLLLVAVIRGLGAVKT